MPMCTASISSSATADRGPGCCDCSTGASAADFGLGPVRDVSLADARILASDYREMVRHGLDPVKELGLRRKAARSFEKVARDCYDAMKGGWKDQRHASWLSSLENHVFPTIGKAPIDTIDSTTVLSVLEPRWLTIPDTARRILQRIGTVLDYAHIKGFVPRGNLAALGDARPAAPDPQGHAPRGNGI